MRNKHRFSIAKMFTCPYKSCGREFEKTVTVEYVTNQRGDVIEERTL